MARSEQLRLEVVSPERLLVNEDVDELQAPAVDGYLGVLPGHAPLLTELGSGVLSFKQGSLSRYIAVHEGVMEVRPDGVRVLASDAEWSDAVDVERARQELDRAMARLTDRKIGDDVEKTEAALARAKARIEAHRRAAE